MKILVETIITRKRMSWASGKSNWRPGPAMSWPAGGAWRGPRQTGPDVRHQPADDVLAEIQNNILIPCRTLLDHEHSWSSGIDSPASLCA